MYGGESVPLDLPPSIDDVDVPAVVEILCRPDHEGCIPYMYLDTATPANVTAGAGNLLGSVSAAIALPWVDLAGELCPPEHVAYWFRQVVAAQPGLLAHHYEPLTACRLEADYIRELVTTRLRNEFVPALERIFQQHGGDFSILPTAIKVALIDMIYSMGPARFAKFVHLITACIAGNWSVAADECHRLGISDARNEWTKEQFESLAA